MPAVQAESHASDSTDLPLLSSLLFTALPALQIFAASALALASHLPSAGVGLAIMKTNPGKTLLQSFKNVFQKRALPEIDTQPACGCCK